MPPAAGTDEGALPRVRTASAESCHMGEGTGFVQGDRAVGSRVVTKHPPDGEAHEGRSQYDEDGGLDALEGPEPAGGLVRQHLVEAVRRQALTEEALVAGWWRGLAGRWELREVDARTEGFPVRADQPLRQRPGAAGPGVTTEQWEHFRHWRHLMRSQVLADRHPEGEEDGQRDGQARQDAADDGPDRDPECDGEERGGDRNDALD